MASRVSKAVNNVSRVAASAQSLQSQMQLNEQLGVQDRVSVDACIHECMHTCMHGQALAIVMYKALKMHLKYM